MNLDNVLKQKSEENGSQEAVKEKEEEEVKDKECQTTLSNFQEKSVQAKGPRYIQCSVQTIHKISKEANTVRKRKKMKKNGTEEPNYGRERN